MKNIVFIAMMPLFLIGCKINASSKASFEFDPAPNVYYQEELKAKGYVQSRDIALKAVAHKEDNEGSGYDDSRWVGSNPKEIPITELTAQQVFFDDDGNIIVLEDDGEIVEV